LYLVDAKVLIYPKRAMGFVQKDDILIVLDETQLDYAIFVLPKHRHFKFGLFDVAVAFGAKSYKTNRDMISGASCSNKANE
jgi:hypothetical protein